MYMYTHIDRLHLGTYGFKRVSHGLVRVLQGLYSMQIPNEVLVRCVERLVLKGSILLNFRTILSLTLDPSLSKSVRCGLFAAGNGLPEVRTIWGLALGTK